MAMMRTKFIVSFLESRTLTGIHGRCGKLVGVSIYPLYQMLNSDIVLLIVLGGCISKLSYHAFMEWDRYNDSRDVTSGSHHALNVEKL